MRTLLIITASALALGGCASFSGGGQPVSSAQLVPTGTTAWTYDLGDPGFAAYLRRADLGSLDVQSALARAKAADAALRAARSEGWPELTLSGGAGRSIPGEGASRGAADLDLVGRWTIDLWGEVRAATGAARADAEAAKLDVEAARAILAMEAARSWLALAAIEDRLGRLDSRRTMEAEGLALVERRIAAGRASKDEALERRANLARIQDEHHAALGERLIARQRLIALAGASSEPLAAAPMPLYELAPFAPDGLSSTDLEKRPDVAAAAARLEAADARRLAVIRAARPKLSLGAALRGQEDSLSGLLERRSLTLTPGVRIEGAMFDGGRAGARADKAAAEAADAEVSYLKAIITAESDLAAALALGAAARARQTPAGEAVSLARQRLQLAQSRLTAGTAARLDAIDAERALVDARDAEASARRALIDASILAQAAILGGRSADASPTL